MIDRKQYQANLPKKRMAAGALFFDEAGRLLLVKPTYRDRWLIPGGVVEANESPRQACIREIQEEIGLNWIPGRLLCVDYCTASSQTTESLKFIFQGGTLSPSQVDSIRLPAHELSEFHFWTPAEALAVLSPKVSRQVQHCLRILDSQETLYLEDQELV